jgi:hypothetical protein
MGCKDVEKDKVVVTEEIKEEPAPDFYFGIDRNNYTVKEFKIKKRGYLWENYRKQRY